MRCGVFSHGWLVLAVALAVTGFGCGERTSSLAPVESTPPPKDALAEPISLLPAETLFLLQIPSMATLGQGFYKAHLETLSNPLMAQLNAKLASNPTVKSPPAILPAPGTMAVLTTTGETCAGEIVVSTLPGAEAGTLSFLAVAQEPWKPKAAALVRDGLAKALNLTWQEDQASGVWAAKASFGVLRFADLGKTFLIGSNQQAFEAAHAALQSEKGLTESLAHVPLYQTARAQHREGLLYFCFINFPLVQPWLEAAPDPKLNLPGKLLKERMSGMLASSWSWENAGPGHVSLDRLVITMDETTAEGMRAFVRPTNPELRQNLVPQALSSLLVNLDATKMAQAPALQGLVGANWLEKWGALPGQGEWLYAVLPGEQASEASQFILVRSNQMAELQSLQAKGDLDLPLIPKAWKAKVTVEGLWLSDAASSASAPPPLDVKDGRMSAFLKATTPNTAPFIDLVINRPEMIKRAVVIARDNYDELAARLRQKGFTVPEKMPEITAPEKLFGLTRMTVALNADNLVMDTSYNMNNTYSSLMTATTVITSFVFQDDMVDTLKIWQRAALPPGGQESPEAVYNLFNLTAWSGILINPAMTADATPSTFVDLLATQLFVHPPLTPQKKPPTD